MAGRGGRGLALLEALKQAQAQQRPGNDEPPVPVPTSTPAPIGAGGRGAGRASLLSMLSARAPSVPVPGPADSGTPSPTPSVAATPSTGTGLPSAGRGRALLLALARERAAAAPSEGAPGLTQTSQPKAPEPVPPIEAMKQMTFVEKPPVIRKGEMGKAINATANFIRLECDPGKGLFEYEVRFRPDVDALNMRYKILNQRMTELGGVKTFDGRVLYLPIQLPDEVTKFTNEHPVDQSPVEIDIIFKRKRRLGECIHLYNVLFNKIFKILSYVRMGRQHFYPDGRQVIPVHKLEVWPGYVTAVDEYEGGIMLNINASSRVLRNVTCYDAIKESLQRGGNWKDEVIKILIGACVLTRYNNKMYRVDDISFDENVLSSFEDRDGTKITFAEYYKKQYGITIKDPQQPLLINKVKPKVGPKKGQEEASTMICLVPELCYLTGLTDTMRADFKVMKDIAVYTRVTPNQRQLALRKFIASVKNNEASRKVLSDWGLQLARETVDLQARVAPAERIVFGKGKEIVVREQADWSRDATNNSVLTAVDLVGWVMIHVQKDTRVAREFVDCMLRVGPQMGINVDQPRFVALRDDKTESYLQALRQNINNDIKLVVTLCPTSRDDRYAAIKKLVCADMPVASQVINTRTISKPDKLRSVVQKIALQINCKLGGTLWGVKIPFTDCMVCGVDTYHEASRRGSSVAGFVASLNPPLTRWFSKVCFQVPGQELVDGLRACLISGLKKYYEVNGKFPDRIIMFRDGVGDGQLNQCAEWEVPQLIQCFPIVSPEYNPKLTVVVVQKRINVRIFAVLNNGVENPPPGTIVDHTITRRDWYDFFLVSQFARQGTVTPTHFVVVYDGCQMKVDFVQRLAYKLTHMYYNWPGTVRVPAPCQYAHKLAYLVGQSIRREPSEKLSDRLYFL